MMKTLTSFLVLLHVLAYSEDPQMPDTGLLTSIDSEPSSMIDGCVNVISGEFVDVEIDMTIMAPEPMTVLRTLVNNNPHPYIRVTADRPYWKFNDMSDVQLQHSGSEKNSVNPVQYRGLQGDNILFNLRRHGSANNVSASTSSKFLRHGFTNNSQGMIGGQTNLRNNLLTWDVKQSTCSVQTSNGTLAKYVDSQTIKHTYLIAKEYRPDTLWQEFTYNSHDLLKQRKLMNAFGVELASYTIHYSNTKYPSSVRYSSCDGREVHYTYEIDEIKHKKDRENRKKVALLKCVQRSEGPEVHYEYSDGRIRGQNNDYYEWPKVTSKRYPDGRFINLKYHWPKKPDNHTDRDSSKLNRLKYVYAPLGPDDQPIVKFRLKYNLYNGVEKEGMTEVYDALGRRIDYEFDSRQRMHCVTKYKNGQPFTQERMYYGPHNTSSEIELQCRVFQKVNQAPTFSRLLHYNHHGDVIADRFYGNLTGHNPHFLQFANQRPVENGSDCLIKAYHYTDDRFHLLLESQVGPLKKKFVYLEGSNLLRSCFHENAQGVYLRHFYELDQLGMVIEHVVDDGSSYDKNNLTGVTERKIERIERQQCFPYGLPLMVSEYFLDIATGVEKLVIRKRLRYDQYGRKIAQDTYDCNDVMRFGEGFGHDAHNNICRYMDPFGSITEYVYDANDNRIEEHGPNHEVKRFYYDYMNRLIQSDEIHPDGTLSKHYRYDLCGNKVEEIDVFGNASQTVYDEFNRPIIVYNAPVENETGALYQSFTLYEYDELSHITKTTDYAGNVTQFKNTVYGKPYHILYPDGSEESFSYDLEGRLLKEVAKNGTTTQFTRDFLGRETKKQIFSKEGTLLVETQYGYNAFHLLWETDPAGNLTTYSYDGFGRKIAAKKGDLTIQYQYDELGRLTRTIEPDTVKINILDVMNQVLEERLENLNHELITSTRNAYDVRGRKIRIEQDSQAGTAVTHITYDSHGIPITTIDPEGHITKSRLILDYYNEHGQRTNCTELIDPMGQVSLKIHDVQGKVVEEIKKDAFGNILQKAKYYYNYNGKLIRSIYKKIAEKEDTDSDFITSWTYDRSDRIIALNEGVGTPKAKTTSMTYNLMGEKTQLIKPDGVILYYSYDALGRLKEFTSSDNAFDYIYTYDVSSNPIQVDDLISETSIQREYDLFGHLLKEKQANNLTIAYEYTLGKLKKTILPDQSYISYQYKNSLLETVNRHNEKGTLLYSHAYEVYDQTGHVLQSSLIKNYGTINYKYTLRGEVAHIESPYFKEELVYNSLSNIIKKNYKDNVGTIDDEYAYDDLYQLTEESGSFKHTYTNDSLYNRTSKDGKAYSLGHLNELLSDEENSYEYDLLGNLKRVRGPNKTHVFNYDALDRLVGLLIDDKHYSFSYDDANRCYQQKCSEAKYFISIEKRLYDGQNEIGTLNEKNQFINLRILGLGKGGEIGAAIAIEIEHQVYAPLHDHNGNLIALIDRKGHVGESYRYSAFGEEKIFGFFGKISNSAVNNPWRFASKRTLHGYVFFGRRLYDPSIGRWTTPDPLGHDAGPNLYAYVLNNPLSHFDPYGLEGDNQSSWDAFCAFAYEAIAYAASCEEINLLKPLMNTISWVGKASFAFSYHIVGIPIVKDFGTSIGHFLEHGTLEDFVPSWQEESSQVYELPGTQLYSQFHALFINGMCNSFDDAINNAQLISNAYGGIPITLAYNATGGFMNDAAEIIIQKLHIHTYAVLVTVDAIRNSIYKVGGVGGGGLVAIYAHSQGGLILREALTFLTKAEKQMLSISTFGSACLINDSSANSCMNYVSLGDWVPSVSDPLNYMEAYQKKLSHVTFFEAQCVVEHNFKDAYNDALQGDVQMKQNKIKRL